MTAKEIIVIPKWKFDFTDTYFVCVNNKVFNIKTRKYLQMQLKGYTKGYYLHGKFYSLSKLRNHLFKIQRQYCPF